MLIFFVILGIGHSEIYNRLNSFPDSQNELHTITSVEIIYRWGDYYTYYYQYYKITNKNETYYTSSGKEIASDLIISLADSLTDLYEATEYEETYEGRNIIDYEPHFEVRLRYANEEKVVMKSDSDYHCFIPWNVKYSNKLYVQYNGKIPTALFRILEALDEGWSFHKESRWGCYSAVVPERYLKKGISQDFPQSKPAVTPEETRGRKHLLWKVHLDSALISSPVYANGRVFIISKDHVLAYDVKTGKKVWNLAFEQFDKDNPLWYYSARDKIAVYKGVVYVCAPDSVVYSLDCETGDILWKFKIDGKIISLKVLEDRVVVRCGLSIDGCRGMICFDREKGEKVWEISGITELVKFYDNKVLFRKRTEESEYYALVDIKSGGLLWKYGTKIDYPCYHQGMLYFGNQEEPTVVCRSLGMEEVWSYEYCKSVDTGAFEEGFLNITFRKYLYYLEVFENGVLLLIKEKGDLGNYFLESVVLLDGNGVKIWKYYYPWEGIKPLINPYILNFEVFENRVFLSRERGFIDVFDTETGEKLWESEVRGTRILDIEVYSNSVYVYANDGRLYCLDLETGEVIWFFETEKDFAAFAKDSRPIFASKIEDGFIFVATKCGNLFAFSLGEFPVSERLLRI